MKIIILRHGKPNIDSTGKITPRQFGDWVSRYNLAGIDPNIPPSPNLIEKAKTCNFIVCSNLPRSIESAKTLALSNAPQLISDTFKECEMPYNAHNFLKLSIPAWATLFRLAQLSGYSPNAESYTKAKQRSKECANQLIELAKHHNKVLFVGHGTLNWFLHKHLLKSGWQGAQKSPKSYWAFNEYYFYETSINNASKSSCAGANQ